MEDLVSIVRSLAALSLALYGAFAILRPKQAARLIHVTPDDNRALTEIRVNLGGFFIGLGLMPFILNVPSAYIMAGGCYIAAAVTRFVSTFVDRPPIDAQYIGLGVLELVLGAILDHLKRDQFRSAGPGLPGPIESALAAAGYGKRSRSRPA